MRLHIYHNNAYDSVVLVNDGRVISYWNAAAPGSEVRKTAFEEALHATDVNDWDDQGHSIPLKEFAEGSELFLVIYADGEWDVEDADLFEDRLKFHFGEDHHITKAFSAGRRW